MARKTGRFQLSPQELGQLANVALGREKADLVILNGTLVDVYTGQALPGYSVACKGERIACVGKNPEPALGPQTQVIDASGKVLAPGLIDGHNHLLNFYTPHEFLRYSMVGGTTTVITESQEIAHPFGYRGILAFLDALRGQPAKIFITAPPMVTTSPFARARALSPAEVRRLLRREEVVGLGETYWLPAIEGEERLLNLFHETLRARKKLEGHSAGARNNKLGAFAALGISSCHEPITAEEVLERLRLGLHVLLRHGSVRRDIEVVMPLLEQGVDLRHFALCSDGIYPQYLLRHGYMEALVQSAIDLGVPPVTAIQMATINVAEHFALDSIIGGIAPGKFADILVLPELGTVKPEWVISNGRAVARNGQLLVAPRKHVFPSWLRRTYPPGLRLTPNDFSIRVGEGEGEARVRVLDYITDLVTQEGQAAMHFSGGFLKPDVGRDLLIGAVVAPLAQPARVGLAVVRGFKMKKGAFALSPAWDSANLAALGTNERDLALAVNRLIELQGGVVICVDGQIAFELATPIAIVLTDLPMEAICQKLDEMDAKLAELGCSFPNAHLSLSTISTAAIPHFRLSEAGLVNIRDGQLVPLLVS